MITREDLKGFTKKELEDIILSNACLSIFERTIMRVIDQKRDEKLSYFETKIETLYRQKETWLNQLREKYNAIDDKDLFKKMNYEETMKYLSMLNEIDKAYDEENKFFDEEDKKFERRYGKQ